jgi:hypothetical protein
VRSAKGSNLYLAARSGATSGSRLVVTDSPGSALAFTFAQTTYAQTTGISELDVKADNILNFVGRDGDVLNKSFWYVVNNYSYRSGSLWPTGNWAPPLALEMINTGSGNCYRYAALFCVLAQRSGYDARVVAGYGQRTDGGWNAHAWVVVRINGVDYVCDPEGQHASRAYNFYLMSNPNYPFVRRL